MSKDILRAISFKNFKAFEKLDLPLGQLTLLTGANSSGKSSVMQALALLRQGAESGVLFDPINPSWILNGDLVELGTGGDVLHEGYAGKAYITIGLASSGGQTIQWTAKYQKDADSLSITPVEKETIDLSMTLGLFSTKSFQYIRADRVSPAVSFPRSYDASVRRGTLGSLGQHTTNYLVEFGDSQQVHPNVVHPKSSSTLLIDQVNAWLSEISPDVHISTQYLKGTDSVQLTYGYGGTAGLSASNARRPTNVGFGLTYVLPVIVAFLSAHPGDLIMIENPEAHLHPRGQTKIAELMSRAASLGAQVLVETHSDHVLNSTRLCVKNGLIESQQVVINYAYRHEDRNRFTSPRIDNNGRLNSWPQGFFDEYETSIQDLLS